MTTVRDYNPSELGDNRAKSVRGETEKLTGVMHLFRELVQGLSD
jgi:hypothetical protein